LNPGGKLPENSSPEYLIYIDASRCVACKSCEIACAVEHSESKTLVQAVFESPKPRPRVKVVVAATLTVPMRCMHCDPAPCIEVCPTKAMYRVEEGYVLSDPVRCIGCRACLIACPFGHPAYSPELKVIKCDHCVERLRQGLPPACVEACPTGALRFSKAEELLLEVKERKAAELVTGAVSPGVAYAKPPEKPSPISVIKEMYKPVRWI